MSELVDEPDLGSGGTLIPYGFNSLFAHDVCVCF